MPSPRTTPSPSTLAAAEESAVAEDDAGTGPDAIAQNNAVAKHDTITEDDAVAEHNAVAQDDAIAQDDSQRVILLILGDQACAGSILMFEKNTFRPGERLSGDGRLRGRRSGSCQQWTAVAEWSRSDPGGRISPVGLRLLRSAGPCPAPTC